MKTLDIEYHVGATRHVGYFADFEAFAGVMPRRLGRSDVIKAPATGG